MGVVKRKLNNYKKMGLVNSCKLCRDRIICRFVPKYVEKRWKKRKDCRCVTDRDKEPMLIVSLTTCPERVKIAHLAIRSLLCQTIKPDLIVLWLANEQFPNKEDDLPIELLSLKKNGLTIEWCDDLKSYKKLIPTIRKYPKSFIMTFDDDQYYLPSTIERLYNKAIKKPNEIHCHRGTKIIISNNGFSFIPGGYAKYKKSTFLHKLTGCCGVCYPPNTLYKDLTNKKLFMTLAPTNDDIWFWLMGVLQGTKCNIISNNLPGLFIVPNSQSKSLNSINDKGEQLFWKDFGAILKHYPNLEHILKKEYMEMMSNYGH